MHTSSQSPLLNKRQSPLLMKSTATDTDIGTAGTPSEGHRNVEHP